MGLSSLFSLLSSLFSLLNFYFLLTELFYLYLCFNHVYGCLLKFSSSPYFIFLLLLNYRLRFLLLVLLLFIFVFDFRGFPVVATIIIAVSPFTPLELLWLTIPFCSETEVVISAC